MAFDGDQRTVLPLWGRGACSICFIFICVLMSVEENSSFFDVSLLFAVLLRLTHLPFCSTSFGITSNRRGSEEEALQEVSCRMNLSARFGFIHLAYVG